MLIDFWGLYHVFLTFMSLFCAINEFCNRQEKTKIIMLTVMKYFNLNFCLVFFFPTGVTYQTSVIENCSEADWDEVCC